MPSIFLENTKYRKKGIRNKKDHWKKKHCYCLWN